MTDNHKSESKQFRNNTFWKIPNSVVTLDLIEHTKGFAHLILRKDANLIFGAFAAIGSEAHKQGHLYILDEVYGIQNLIEFL